MQHRGFTPIAIVVVLVVVFLAAGAWYWNERRLRAVPLTAHNVAQLSSNPTITSGFTSTTGASGARISQWETYADSRYAFSFRYPPELRVVDNGPYSSNSGTQQDSLDDIGVYTSSSVLIDIGVFNAGIVQGDYGWPERPCGEWTFGPDSQPLASKQVLFAKQKTLDVVSRAFGRYPATSTPETYEYYCINYRRNPLVITFDQKDADEAQPILATFEFVNFSTSSVST